MFNQNHFEILSGLVGKKATIFKYGEMGFAHSIMCEIKEVYSKDYAQYNNILHVVYRPKGKRTDYVWRLFDYADFMVYEGHVVLNTEMFVKESPSNGMVMRESLLSFSPEYLTRAKASTTATPVLIQCKEEEITSPLK